MLIDHTIIEAQKLKKKYLFIGTGDFSFRQLKLYRSKGFENFYIRKDFFIKNYPKPIYENGHQLKDMVLLRKDLTIANLG